MVLCSFNQKELGFGYSFPEKLRVLAQYLDY